MDPAIEAVLMPGVSRTYDVGHPALRWTVHPDLGAYPMFFVRRSNPSMTIVYAHPNDCDLGSVCRLLYCLSDALNATVVAPEYFGYGLLDQRPRSVANSAALVAHAIKVMGKKYKGPVVAVGQSVGTAMIAESLRFRAVVELVSRVVLIAPFSSVRSIADPLGLTVDRKIDNLDVARRLRNVLAHSPHIPIAIIHGDKDRLIPVEHSRQIQQLLGDRVTLDVVPGGTHTDFGGGAPALAARIAALLKNSSSDSQ